MCNESNPCTDTTYDNDVRLAHRYAGETYDFYATNHSRDSLNSAGMKLISTADYCDPSQPCPYANAFWNGTQMAYGDDFAAADYNDLYGALQQACTTLTGTPPA